ncbi:MAG: pyruvate formate lyase family protein, partial [Promethearchaeota archaeon]
MSDSKHRTEIKKEGPNYNIAEPHNLSKRSKWLREYYFRGVEREWNNEYMSFTTGTDWDIIWCESDYYITPEIYFYIGNKGKGVFEGCLRSVAIPVSLPGGFWDFSLPERKIKFFKKVMLDYVPHEIISENDLIAGGRFNTYLSDCLTKAETKKYWKENLRNRHKFYKFHKSGFGNTGATPGHLIPDHETIIEKGFKYIHEKINAHYEQLSEKDKNGAKGQELRAMLEASEIPRKFAKK